MKASGGLPTCRHLGQEITDGDIQYTLEKPGMRLWQGSHSEVSMYTGELRKPHAVLDKTYAHKRPEAFT